MSETKHTPGQWRVTGENSAGFGISATDKIGGVYVGVAYGHSPEHKANADLMAAAPELLASLKGIIDTILIGFKVTGKNRKLMAEQVFKDALVAIEKATGEKPSDFL